VSYLPAYESKKISQRLKERVIFIFLAVCGSLSIFTTIGIIFVLLFESLQFFKRVPIWDFLTDKEWSPLFLEKHFGIAPLLTGTLLTTVIALIVAFPLGLLSAIYLAEYAHPKVRQILKPIMEVLAGIPTVVYGYFALLFVTPLLQKVIPGLQGFNALSPGIVMGIMILPMVASLSEDSMYTVPQSLKDAAYAMGSSRFQVALRVVVPAAFSGIIASGILATSRAIGETMIVAIAAGQQPNLTLNPLVAVETMTTYIVQVSLGDTPHGTLEYQTIFVVGLSLFVLTVLFNWLSLRLRKSVYEKYG
jgi:phosphate transport system permease protein